VLWERVAHLEGINLPQRAYFLTKRKYSHVKNSNIAPGLKGWFS
jgi:hypothetical protein